MSYLKRVFDDLDLIEAWHRDAMSPEERAAYDRRQRREAAVDTALGLGGLALGLSVSVLPWAVGAYTMASWVLGRGAK